MNTGANDTLFAYVLVDPCEPPREIVMRWNASGDWGAVAYWGDDFLRYGYALRLRFGPVPNSGGWIRLEVPASYLGRASKNIRGLQLIVYGGRAWVDHVGKTSCTTPIASAPSSFPGAESVWFDDNIPSGASRSGTWNWDTSQKASGAQSHTTPVSAWGSVDDHSFTGATSTLQPTANDDLFAYALMDPCFPPREIMIGWYDGSWEHRAYWGDDVIGEGSYPNGRFYMGPLPPAGQWIKLAVPAAKLGLAGRTITGMIFSVQGGKVWFDRAGKTAGTVAGLRRAPATSQYALLRTFGIDRFGTPTAALWDFDRPTAPNDAPVPVRRYFLYTPELNLMAETELTANATPAVQYEYIWFGGQPLAQVMSATNQILWYFDDHLGTPILQTDSAGAVVWRAEYEPYGSIYKLRVAANPHQPLRLPGQEAEQLDTGTNGATERSYNIFRWYRAGWGRYTQFDPIGNTYWPTALGPRIYSRAPGVALPQLANPTRVHPFGYAAANPLSNEDPRGLRVQTRGCDPPANCLETDRTRPCCDCHDVCFATYNCSAGRDWAQTASYLAAIATALGPPLPPPPPCVICNLWVTNCFVNSVLPNWRPPRCPWPEMPGTWPPNSWGPRWN